ncbi:hypothetical protein ACFLY4_06500 [Chloroflexota bacterium]
MVVPNRSLEQRNYILFIYYGLSINILESVIGRLRDDVVIEPEWLTNPSYPSKLHRASCTDPVGDQYFELGGFRLWKINGSEITSRILTGHTHFIYVIALCPDGGLLAPGSADETVS